VLAHANPSRTWSAVEIADQLYIPTETANGILIDLVASEILAPAPTEPLTARYAPRSETVDRAVGELVEVYARRVVDVTRLIHAHGGDNAQRLADAFRLGRRT